MVDFREITTYTHDLSSILKQGYINRFGLIQTRAEPSDNYHY